MSRSMGVISKSFKWLFVLGLMISVNTFAQDETESKEKKEETQAEAAPSKKKFEKVSVVGSRIRRTDFEGPAPVKVIDRKSIDDSSYNSVGDYLRDLPISSFGSARESTGSNAGNTSSVNLRGLGASNTLILLNNARMQVDGRTGSPDMNLIPEIAIDSTEILKDGASAIYGADAIGGVVLLKTRKDFTGVEGSVKYVLPEEEGGSRFDLSVIGGKQYDNFSVTAAVQYRKNEETFTRDREFTKAVPENLNNGWSDIGPTPTYLSGAGTAAVWKIRPEERAKCDADPENQQYALENGNEFCRYAWANEATELPSVEQYSAYFNTVWTPSSRITLDTTAYYSSQFTEGIFAPVPQTLYVTPAGVASWGLTGTPLDNPNVFNNSDDADDPRNGSNVFRYRAVEAGNRIFEFESQAFNFNTELSSEFGETWEWKNTLGFGISKNRSETSGGALLRDAFFAAANSGDFNPFNPSAAGIQSAFYQPYQKTESINYTVDSNISGELFELKNGLPVGAAFGAQYNHMYYSDRPDAQSEVNNVIGGASSGGGGNRDIASLYGEMLFPLSKKIEVQAAARFDWFSDAGTAFSPMVAAKYAPSRQLMFRSSVGKAFKAPLLQDLYAASANGFPFVIDHVECNKNPSPDNPLCAPQQYQNILESNQNLDPEEAISYNVGVVYAPTAGFSVTADFWQVDLTNVIGVNLEQITLAQAENVALPSSINVVRQSNGEIASISTPNQNLSERTQNGLDIVLAYSFNTKFGKFRITDDHSHTFTYDQKSLPGLATISLLDDFGIPEWRNALSLTYSPSRKHSFTITHNTIAGQKSSNRFNRIKTYGETDISYLTRVSRKGQLNIGVKNVFGLVVPFDRYLGFDSGLYNPLGRYAFVNYRHSF